VCEIMDMYVSVCVCVCGCAVHIYAFLLCSGTILHGLADRDS